MMITIFLFRLFCTWHIDRAWRQNITKVKTKVEQVCIKNIRLVPIHHENCTWDGNSLYVILAKRYAIYTGVNELFYGSYLY